MDREVEAMKPLSEAASAKGFTLVEILLVIAIIGVMSALIVAAVTNSAEDSRMVVARQQQAVLQEAVTAWATAQASGTSSVSAARTMYNTAGNSLARLVLVKDYLDIRTYEHFTNYSPGADQIQSEAMSKVSVYLQMPTWATNSYPRVNMVQ